MIGNGIALVTGLLITSLNPPQAAADGNETPAQFMSKMLVHYANAKSGVGTIRMTQTAANVTIHINTELQFDRPSKIYLHQVRDGARAKQWFLTADGKEFSYDRPNDLNPAYSRSRFVEYVTQHDNNLNLGDFLSAAGHSLGDINPMIETAIGSNAWLQKLIGQWSTLAFHGRETVNGQSAQVIVGDYREKPGAPITGQYTAYITDAGDFLKYVLHQRFEFPAVSKEAVDVNTVWESDLKLGAPTDPSLYRIISKI